MRAVSGTLLWAILGAFYLAACILLGGASAAGAIANAMLQAGAVVVILLLAWRGRLHVPRPAWPLAWVVVLLVLLVLASLIPLSLATWQGLPFRAELADGLRQLGIQSGSLAISLAPSATIASSLSLLPPVAMFLLVTSLTAERRNILFGTLVGLTLASIAFGVAQLLGGPGSPLRLYEITNDTSPVGFFANVNHHATLALATLPCLAALAARFAGRKERSRRRGGFIIAIAGAAFILLGIGLMGSMAGYGLLLPAIAGSLLIYWRALVARISWGWRIGVAALGIVFMIGALLGPLSQQRLSDKFASSPTSRGVIAETTLRPIADSFPLGTGLGTFSDVYRLYQDPAAASTEYVNHAHDDYLEAALELGLPGIFLILLFILWWLFRLLQVWRDDFPNAASARAGSVIVGIVLLHSLVDYPIRTAAIAAVFAMGCARLVPARPSSRPARESETRGERGRHIKITGDNE